VTGSKCGTSDDPEFALLNYFMHLIFPCVKDLVKVGGRYEGYLPIFQGDNAGPHKDAKYKKISDGYETPSPTISRTSSKKYYFPTNENDCVDYQ